MKNFRFIVLEINHLDCQKKMDLEIVGFKIFMTNCFRRFLF